MFYPQEVISEVRVLNDVVEVIGGYVRLTPRAGSRHFGLCPFHSENSASFSVNRDGQFFYCFGCGASGDVVRFIMQIENMDFPEALKLLAARVHYNLPEKGTGAEARKRAALRESAAEINKRAARYYYDYLNSEKPDAGAARDYLKERGIESAQIKRFGIGLSPPLWNGLLTELSDIPPEELADAGLALQSRKDERQYYDRFRSRIMFPIIDSRNRVVGFGGRIFGNAGKDEAKYLNSPETALFHKSEQLYGLNLARKTRAKEILIVEGYMDVIAMHIHGFKNTAGVLGTALTEAHTRLLRGASADRVILVMDSDEAGIRAALRAIPILTKGDIKVKILNIPEVKDPDEYLMRFGAKKFEKILQNAKSHISFQIDLIRDKHDLNTMDGRVGFTHEAAGILAALPSAIEVDAYVAKIAGDADISPGAIHAEVSKIQGKPVTTNKIISTPRVTLTGAEREDPGLTKARKGLLHLILTNPAAAKSLEKNRWLTSEEMGGGVLAELMAFACKNAESGIPLSPGDIMDRFDSPERQKTIAEIFLESGTYPTKTAEEKAFSDMIKRIKIAAVDSALKQETDLNTVNKLHSDKKNAALLNITISA